ncbi:MAG: NTP transferase domain-containing protein, partial [Gemmatimonadetes bacterium]|nr:NTP transferase domain-containing protein [Gemmatimonadota bacterium]
RIRSATSKMLHEIWGRPTVQRVADAVAKGIDSPNQVIVVGIKGEDVARTLGAREGRIFAYQESPVLGLPGGTGDAVRVALEHFDADDRTVYVFPGDMGLLTQRVVTQFRCDFDGQRCDMMVLTGLYDGAPESNYYGRIVRVPEVDADDAPTGEDAGRVIAIKEHKDILGLPIGGGEELHYKGRRFFFSRDELLRINEINTLVVAFRETALRQHIGAMDTDNVQGELMLTDLVEIFNSHGLVVRAVPAVSEEEILGFNVKSVWRQMESIATRRSYERLMDIVTIVDEDDFYLDDDVIDHIIALDEQSGPLDIVIGKGVQVSAGVQLAPNVHLGDRCRLSGGIVLEEDVRIGSGVELSTHDGQTMILRRRSQVLARSVLKGNLILGAGSRVESGVLMTGSDEHPMRVGDNVTIKGTSYLYGCLVDADVTIEHSVIKGRHVHRVERRDGSIQPIRYVLPQPEGLDSIAPITD